MEREEEKIQFDELKHRDYKVNCFFSGVLFRQIVTSVVHKIMNW